MKAHVYVAGKFEEKEAVREVQRLLRERGHTITHDWTDCDVSHADGKGVSAYLARCAEDDVTGASSCDALVVLHHPRGCGMLVEVGIALGCCLPVIVIGARDERGLLKPGSPIFYHLPYVRHVDTADEAVTLVERFVS